MQVCFCVKQCGRSRTDGPSGSLRHGYDSPLPTLDLSHERSEPPFSDADVSLYSHEMRSILCWAELRAVCVCVFKGDPPTNLCHGLHFSFS